MDERQRNVKTQKKITDQDTNIAELKRLMVYYKEITETVREPFVILDKDLCVVTANLAFYQKFKVHKKDTEGKRIYDLGSKQWDSLDLCELLDHILPTHKVMNSYEVTHDFPFIGTKTILLNARQVDSKQLILLAMEDVTLQKKLQADSNKITKNLTQQRDLLQGLSDAKDEFVSLASHQLRMPVTAVKQYIGMVMDGYVGTLTSEQKQLLGVAYKNNERQLEVVEDLLRVARIDGGQVFLEKSSCNVVDEVKKAIQEQAVLFKARGQTVVLHAPRKAVSASIDPKLVSMVLENLLDNAGKYSRQGTEVTVQVTKDNDYVVVKITDCGVGIRKKTRKNYSKNSQGSIIRFQSL